MARGLLYAGVVALACLPVSAADDPTGNWPQWRGPKRDGISTDTGLLTTWPAGGPKLLWEAKGAGKGFASLAIVGGKIYTMGDSLSTANDKDEYASCFDAATGKQLWTAKLGAADKPGGYDGSHATPNVDGDFVYYMTPRGVVVCLKAADGTEVWRKDLQKDFQGKKGDGWGYSESVLIDGDNLICTPGMPTHTLVALNKKTGEKVWSASAAGDTGAGHSSVVISEIGNTRVYVQTTSAFVLGVRAKDGKVLWTYPTNDPKRVTAVIPTPIIKGEYVLAAAGYGKGAALLKQVAGPDGNVQVEQVYGFTPAMANKHGGLVLLGEYVYGDKDDGGGIYCANLMTREQARNWVVRGSGSGSAAVTAADGHLYVRYASGTMALVKADPAVGYKEVGTFAIPHATGARNAPSWSHPVVTGNRLYLREGDWIMCYDVKAK